MEDTTIGERAKVHFEKLKLHWNNPTDWIVLEDGEVHFILDEIEIEADEETVALSERAASFAEEEKLANASGGRLKTKLPEDRQRKREASYVKRKAGLGSITTSRGQMT